MIIVIQSTKQISRKTFVQVKRNILEMGYLDTNAFASVRADLLQVDPCTGAQTILCSVLSTDATAPTCAKCDFRPAINFGTNLYYVEVTLTHTASTVQVPQLFTLRIF